MNTPFKILQDEWVLIAPIGDHPHTLGVQRITIESNQRMANRFNGLIARLGRLFTGAPTFEGHHDIDPQTYPNGRSYGWITALENRGAEGLWGKMTWTPEGRQLLENGAFKFVSPLFDGKPIGTENGKTIFDVFSFVSLALTNNPNLTLPPLANSHPHMKKLTDLLALPETATADEICTAAEKLANEKASIADVHTTLKNELKSAGEQLKTERTQRISLLLDNAVREKLITLAERTHWEGEMLKDLAAAQTALSARKPVLPTESQTKNLGNENRAFQTEATRRTELLAFITEKQNAGLTYDQAWQLAKRERAALFEQMGKK